MLSEQECETKERCPECGNPMYMLKGAINPIYVCSQCGCSADEKTLENQNQNQIDNKGKKTILRNLFPDQFMKKYTEFFNFSDFIETCDFFNDSLDNLTKESITNIPERKINRYVRKHTCFSTWNQMFEKAVEWYLRM